jgi:hypothetical protein
MTSLKEIRERLLAQEAQTSGSNRSGFDNVIYPFWNIPENSSDTIRFLPDANESNPYFWRERQMIRIPFNGIKGGDEKTSVTVNVPCMEMWDERCPIHDELRPWFKDPALEDTARVYWKKRSYLFQGFVVSSDMTEEDAPENKIRRFQINPQIFNVIKSALMDPDFDELPTDYESGTDFKLTKSKKGQWADYSTSNWARKSRALSETEREAIATHGLFDLNDFMPKKPNEEELKAIVEMFEASVDGQMYDPERWAAFYRPRGVEKPNANAAPAATNVVTPQLKGDASDTNDEVPFDLDDDDIPAAKVTAPVEPAAAKPAAAKPAASAQDILAAIRNRS